MKFIGQYIIDFLENWHRNRVRNHIFFWLFNISVFMSFEAVYGNPLNESILIKLFFLPSHILTSYFAAYFLAPLLTGKKYFRFLLSLDVGTYWLCVFTRYTIIYGLETALDSPEPKDSIYDIFTNFEAKTTVFTSKQSLIIVFTNSKPRLSGQTRSVPQAG